MRLLLQMSARGVTLDSNAQAPEYSYVVRMLIGKFHGRNVGASNGQGNIQNNAIF